MLNFNWWVNRKDPAGRNVFAGGFLGLDNIGIFDRSAPLPTGGSLEQADGTAWMAFYCQSMLEMAIILTEYDPMYEEIAFKFVQHFMWIAYAMDRRGEHHDEMWDEQDGFFYDLLRLPDGQAMRLKVRSMVGLLPLCASTVFEADAATRYPKTMELIAQFRKRHPELMAKWPRPTRDSSATGVGDCCRSSTSGSWNGCSATCSTRRSSWGRTASVHSRVITSSIRSCFTSVARNTRCSTCRRNRIPHVRRQLQLARSGLDAGQFADRPGAGESVRLYGDEFKVECPTGSGRHMTLFEVAQELVRRLTGTFLRDADGKRPVYGGTAKFQDDPHWRDLILFYEYFHGDNGAGLGASHQTGWTGSGRPPAGLVRPYRRQDPAGGRARAGNGQAHQGTSGRRTGEERVRSGYA